MSASDTGPRRFGTRVCGGYPVRGSAGMSDLSLGGDGGGGVGGGGGIVHGKDPMVQKILLPLRSACRQMKMQRWHEGWADPGLQMSQASSELQERASAISDITLSAALPPPPSYHLSVSFVFSGQTGAAGHSRSQF